MSIRGILNRSPVIVSGLAVVPILAVVALVIYYSLPPRVKPPVVYYTVDDGKSFFTDDRNPVPPYDRDGQQAVQAHVFSCDGGQHKFVGYMTRYNPEGKRIVEEARAIIEKVTAEKRKLTLQEFGRIGAQRQAKQEWKRPGEQWQPLNPMASPDRQISCPGGTQKALSVVE